MRLDLRGITKRFGDVVANDDVSLSIAEGEIVCLLGENGAGKSTLMNLLYGVIGPDAGELAIDGTVRRFDGPRDAIDAGIGMVHQHFTLVPTLTVAENVTLGSEPAGLPFGWLDRRRARQDVERLSEQYGLAVAPDALVEDLSVGLQQRVEIIKALRRDAELLILDEPTAVLTPQESERLFDVMRQLRTEGRSLIFISHKLREVRAVADRIVVMRHGRVVGESDPKASESELAALMVGRPVDLRIEKPAAMPGNSVLSLDGIALHDEGKRPLLSDVDVDVRAGEVVALAGVQGNGQAELVDLLLGLRHPSSGTIRLLGEDVTGRSTREMLEAGVGFVPEDRNRDGLVGDFSVTENLILDTFRSNRFSERAHLRRRAIAENAQTLIGEFDIRAASPSSTAGSLSGGNAQKIVLARELSRPLVLLVAVEPTRGLDIGSVDFVRRRLLDVRAAGMAVVLVSSDLDEIVALSDRIAVLYRGEVVGVVEPDVPRERLGLMMAGAATQEAHV
jgi:general nucleoside transport system ATP-binding protein